MQFVRLLLAVNKIPLLEEAPQMYDLPDSQYNESDSRQPGGKFNTGVG